MCPDPFAKHSSVAQPFLRLTLPLTTRKPVPSDGLHRTIQDVTLKKTSPTKSCADF